MVYLNEFRGEKLSSLGFGTMRLPLIEGGTSADIDQEKVNEMVDYAIGHGVNYFDTAYPYHESKSEYAIGKALARYPRETWNLADKFPGHQIMDEYNVEEIFEDQLRKCGVDYFDFYLLHNVNNASVKTYTDPDLDIIGRVYDLKQQGKIRHLGFSCHGDMDCIKHFLEVADGRLEFCQIQMNYLDWTLQGAKEKYEYLTEQGLGVWVMEPVRGGKLAKLYEKAETDLDSLRPGASMPSWAFRFLQGLDNVKVILSGMSNIGQMIDNCDTFSERKPLSQKETETLLEIAENLKNAVPCTGCRYCCDGCPMQIDIPKMIAIYNDYRVYPSANISMAISAVPEDRRPGVCIGCGQCASICPQGIKVPELMKTMDECFSALPSWAQMCKEREEAAKKNK